MTEISFMAAKMTITSPVVLKIQDKLYFSGRYMIKLLSWQYDT